MGKTINMLGPIRYGRVNRIYMLPESAQEESSAIVCAMPPSPRIVILWSRDNYYEDFINSTIDNFNMLKNTTIKCGKGANIRLNPFTCAVFPFNIVFCSA